MQTLTSIRAYGKAFKHLPPETPMSHDDLFWFVKDFYEGKYFIQEGHFHYALYRYSYLLQHEKINGVKMFWLKKSVDK